MDHVKSLFVAAFALLSAHGGSASGEGWVHLTTDEGLPGNEVQFLRECPDGAVWIGTLTGLGFYRDGKCDTLVQKAKVWDVVPAGEERYWVGTEQGVLLSGREQAEPALKGYSIAPLVQVSTERIWTVAKDASGQKSFMAQYDGKEWMPVKALEKEKVKDLFRARDGRLWASVEGNGILEIPSCNATDQALRHLEGREVTAFQEDSRGRIWCGTWEYGLHVLEKGQWSRQLPREKSAILDIDEDRRGGIWVATNAHGLWRLDGETWVNDLKEERGINLMEPTSDGRVWISNQARGGLRFWDGKAWREALPGPLPMRCLLETRSGDLWVGGVLDGVRILKRVTP
jgi:ligand-binding sensor domain-containing protein